MVVVVNGLLSNGRLPHAYYYKRPRPVEWLNHGGGLREPRSRHGALQALTELARRTR